MTHSITHSVFDRRSVLRDLVADLAEHAGNLLGRDRGLTHDQRTAVLALMTAAWAVADGLADQQEAGR